VFGNPDGEKYFQIRKKDSPENRHEGETFSMRQVPQAKPEASKKSRAVVLPKLLA
jgi:hypothetical protein